MLNTELKNKNNTFTPGKVNFLFSLIKMQSIILYKFILRLISMKGKIVSLSISQFVLLPRLKILVSICEMLFFCAFLLNFLF